MLITLLVANYTIIQRVVVDNGCSKIILLWNTFKKMGINHSRLSPSLTLLKGLSRDTILSVGTITLRVVAGKELFTSTTMTDFLVVK